MNTNTSSNQTSLRLWPAIAIVATQWVLRFIVPMVYPEALPIGIMGGLLAGALILIWWAFFSKAEKKERLVGALLMIVAMVTTPFLLHASVATGMMGMMFPIYAIPLLSLSFVLWAYFSDRFSGNMRWATMAAAIFLPCLFWALVQTGGFTSDLEHDFAWRWSETREDRLIAGSAEHMAKANAAITDSTLVKWAGYRGTNRDGVITDKIISTDWQSNPPVEIWRQEIGPGWSSFAAQGDVFFTQEQRGEEEMVSCYRLSSGDPVWRYGDNVRFWESNAGAGPRGTPTLHSGRVFTLGATGIVNALNAATGKQIWTRNASDDTGTKTPTWGYSGSPLVIDSTVYVAASGAIIAYDMLSGEVIWNGPKGGGGYSSPHLASIDGVRQILQLNGDGLVSVNPGSGKLLWKHDWDGYPIVQPAITSDGDVMISVNQGSGLRRINIIQNSGSWTTKEVYTSIRLKPYFSDFVIHEGYAYGIDGRILACMDLKDGKRVWKGGRYGSGQLFLLPQQDLLVIISEKGKLALASATPEKWNQLAEVPAISGKTWNHPVLVDDILLVRNAQEMAAFRLATTR
ncbi:MAG: PQQ-binding-like beta-propeller repeat protein [Calditrichia bacterium]